jgi:hypothetical protein
VEEGRVRAGAGAGAGAGAVAMVAVLVAVSHFWSSLLLYEILSQRWTENSCQESITERIKEGSRVGKSRRRRSSCKLPKHDKSIKTPESKGKEPANGGS